MKEMSRSHRKILLHLAVGVALLSMLLSACTTSGNAPVTSAPPVQLGQGVTPLPAGGPRVVSDRPAAVEKLVQGTPLAGDQKLTLTFYLAYNDAAMEQRVAQIYTPGSPFYQHYLSPEQIAQQFAESDAQLNTVKSWLTGHGYSILALDPLRSSLTVQATVAAINQSLSVQMQSFTAFDRTFYMPKGAPTLSGEREDMCM